MDKLRDKPVPYEIWGKEDIEPSAREQMERAAQLSVSQLGALMPDAHTGYGLPIGGVLATKDAVIPYGVGVDIACRMRMTIFNVQPYILDQKKERFRRALEENTVFGTGGQLFSRAEHPVMDDPAWGELILAKKLKAEAARQLGTSGSGNHFVEFGVLKVKEEINGTDDLQGEGSRAFGKIPPGTYLALLSHSGSRHLGFELANYYTEIAMNIHADLPKEYRHLAWLDMYGAGAEYWIAMNLAGRYASANHAIIHQRVADAIGFDILGGIENHHNFAWKETHQGEELIVHRKGATPAGLGVYGVIPGTMMTPGFVVRGKGKPESLNSASHGAGRRMSRQAAYKRFEWPDVQQRLKDAGVELLSGGLDEAPGAYKDIRKVMEEQADLVEIVAEFAPRVVKMDPDKTWRRRSEAAARDRSGSKDRRDKKDKRRD
ncbi:MAG: RtcB family protein [Chloroflexi bacterium]|nr:RtcB family protein [Chloroflexota bacterium]